METKLIIFCAIIVLFQIISIDCIGRIINYENRPLAAESAYGPINGLYPANPLAYDANNYCPANLLPFDANIYNTAKPLAYDANIYAPANPLAYEAGILSVASLSASHGGGFSVRSSSPIPARGVSVESENLLIEGPLSVNGQLPFLSTIALEGALPAIGTGVVEYGCGCGNVGISEEYSGLAGPVGAGYGSGYGPLAPGYGPIAPGYGPIAPGYAPIAGSALGPYGRPL